MVIERLSYDEVTDRYDIDISTDTAENDRSVGPCFSSK